MTERGDSSSSKERVEYRRVVVTGIGTVSPLGLDTETTWKNLINGQSGISPIEIEHTGIKVAGTVKGFEPNTVLAGFVLPKDLRRISRPAQLSLASSIEALKNSGLLTSENKLRDGTDPKRIGVRIGTGVGGTNLTPGVSERLKAGQRLSPFDILLVLPERVSSVVSMKLGLKGPVGATSAACATGNLAITDGYKDIFLGDADVTLAGGVESTLDPVTLSLFDAVGALSHETDPKTASRPFDKKRNGFVMSEGAGIIVLEEFEHAKRRGAEILAELSGYGNTADAQDDVAPSGEGAERAMRIAIEMSGGLPKSGVIYVNAHATSTKEGDRIEEGVIRRVFKGRHKHLLVSSTKGATGHLMGAAGAIEAIFCIKVLNEGVVPPTLNLIHPLKGNGRKLNLVPQKAQAQEICMAVNNSFGFGGINAVTIFTRPK